MGSALSKVSSVWGKSNQAKWFARLLLLCVLLALYVLFFPLLHQTFGWISVSFSWCFIGLSVWFWGLRGGVLAALLNYPLNMVLLKNIGAELQGGLPAFILMVSVAAILGRLRDLSLRLREQLEVRKKTEEALRDSQDALEQRVAERTADLKTANKQLRREITERRHTEAALRESEEKLKQSVSLLSATLDSTADGILAVNGEGKIVRFNKIFVEMWRIPDSVIATKDSDQALVFVLDQLKEPESFLKKVRELYSQLAEESFDVLEFKDGRIFERYSQAQRIKSKSVGRVWSFRDVTDRKRAEEALRESEQKYRDLVDNTSDLFYRTDVEGKLVFISPSTHKLSGYTVEEAIGMKVAEEVYANPEVRALFLAKLQEDGYVEHFEAQLKRKDGSSWWASTNAHFFKGQDGNIKGVEGIIRDITSQKKAEKDREDLETQLQRAQKMEAIGTLAGGVAHDLNNILGGLVSYPELLLLQLPLDSPLRKSILTIQKSGEKAAAVVQDLLTLARRGVVTSEVVNLNDVVYDYLESPEHENLQEYHPGTQIETHLEKDLLNILGSPTHLSKTIMNLISNAAEAMPEGGALTVSTENRYIDRPIKGYDDVLEGDYVILTVSDIGTGISPDDIEKIFEPFYTKKKMGRSGTGLGMAVVWGTVKDHKGYIHVQSTEGKGTTFTLYFPVTRKSIEERSEISLKDYMGKGEAILVVDDVEEQRNIASSMLRELGYSVVSVPGGEEAVEYLKTNRVHLLLLDMIMDPGMDGLDTYKKILQIHPGQKAIIASGFSETDRVKEVQSLGAGAYIRKPLLLEKVGVAVKEELEK